MLSVRGAGRAELAEDNLTRTARMVLNPRRLMPCKPLVRIVVPPPVPLIVTRLQAVVCAGHAGPVLSSPAPRSSSAPTPPPTQAAPCFCRRKALPDKSYSASAVQGAATSSSPHQSASHVGEPQTARGEPPRVHPFQRSVSSRLRPLEPPLISNHTMRR